MRTRRTLGAGLLIHEARAATDSTEFRDYKDIEAAERVEFCFATPHHSWERGTNENTNGLIRQYLPKGKSMAELAQEGCDAIAAKLNNRPRKRLGFQTPEGCDALMLASLHFGLEVT